MTIPFTVLATSLLLAVTALAGETNRLSDAQLQGLQLAKQLAEQKPIQASTTTGLMKIHAAKGDWVGFSLACRVILTPTNWQSVYQANWTNRVETLLVVHTAGQPNAYYYETNSPAQVPILDGLPTLGHLFRGPVALSGNGTMIPFADSDFWLCDLGLEFFHWPEQKILPNPTSLKRGRSYRLLESTNPNPSTHGYARVLSWIDQETGGILQAEAYDAQNRLLKEFAPKSFKKVDGQWELQGMEIDNVQTGSRTRLEFDLQQ